MKAESPEASPVKAVVEELETFRAAFHGVLASYSARIDEEIARITETVKGTSDKKIPNAKLRDLRDMLTVLRHAQVKADKGRRKDLKKIDSLVGDLAMLIENW